MEREPGSNEIIHDEITSVEKAELENGPERVIALINQFEDAVSDIQRRQQQVRERVSAAIDEQARHILNNPEHDRSKDPDGNDNIYGVDWNLMKALTRRSVEGNMADELATIGGLDELKLEAVTKLRRLSERLLSESDIQSIAEEVAMAISTLEERQGVAERYADHLEGGGHPYSFMRPDTFLGRKPGQY